MEFSDERKGDFQASEAGSLVENMTKFEKDIILYRTFQQV